MNIINKYFFGPKVEVIQVETEQELLGKVEEVVGKVLKDQKVHLNFQSAKNPNYLEIVKFGYREGDHFLSPDVKVKFNIKSMPSEKKSNVLYDVEEKVCAEIKESVSIKKVSSSSNRYELQGNEEEILQDHPQLSEKGSLEFFKIAKKYPEGSETRILTAETSGKIKSIIEAKLKEISPIQAPREFGDDFRDLGLRLFRPFYSLGY
jgi:hypothetical protein